MPPKKVKFFRAVWRSCTDPSYYAHVLKTHMWSSWKYFIGLYFFITIAATVIACIAISQFDLPTIIRDVHTQALENYPEDLEIMFSQEGLSINQPLPYVVPIPEQWQHENLQPFNEEEVDNLIVFTSDETFSYVRDFWEYDSAVVATETLIYVRKGESNQITVQPLNKFTDSLEQPVIITHELIALLPVEDVTNLWFLQRLFYVPILGLLLFVVIYPGAMIFAMIKLLIYALILFILLRIFMGEKKLPYDKCYQVSIHADTPILVLGLVLSFVKGLIAFIGFFIFALVMIAKMPKVSTKKKKVRSKR